MARTHEEVGELERTTQNRVVDLFKSKLKYRYLGIWEERANNSNIEVDILRSYLIDKKKYSKDLVDRAIDRLKIAANNYNRSLYENNREVYELLRYGIKVKPNAGEHEETVLLIDWNRPLENDFAIAEEVTVYGQREKRPDVVLYINGIAVGVLELKRSTSFIGNGIRQSIVNQQPEFIQKFFSTIQYIFAGNNSEGLRYGTIGTPEKYYLNWKEDVGDNSTYQLDKYLTKICSKERFIELLYDFVLFDGGVKKLPRPHQYFGIKEAQKFVKEKEGGIIWHTQGSGKSIVMVFLAKWILENNPNARIVIITDRDELDKQIKDVFTDAGEKGIYRTKSARDLMTQLGNPSPRLICSLVHKFGIRGENDFEKYIEELKNSPSKTVGELFVFVDECHRTQSGKLHRVMKAILKESVFIGFTGTPLLKKDKETSLEIFGKYIHTYKFKEAVTDGVILDLVYEARDIDQRIPSSDKIDTWFEAKTKVLNEYQKNELKKKWGTMQKVLSSKSRMDKIVLEVIHDFTTKPRLSSEKGNAILVAGSIYEACKYYEIFLKTPFKNKCAVVTSYNPSQKDIVTEDTGESTETEKEFIYSIYKGILYNKDTDTWKSAESYEDESKEKFKDEPANMKLLIVRDKLLTGFDAPSCTYLYIDKSMQDHGLFQAICRVNRLDGDDKTFGYIVDYKNLLEKIVNEDGTGVMQVYNSEIEHAGFEKEECDVLLQDKLKRLAEELEKALDKVTLLCEPVTTPKDDLAYINYFCGNSENQEDLKKNEFKRVSLYKNTASLVRAYAAIADEMNAAGYTKDEAIKVKQDINRFLKIRDVIRKASGETIDLKSYEADMRHLIDNYIQADEPRKISPLDDMSLLDIISKVGVKEAAESVTGEKDDPKEATTEKNKKKREAAAEAIENNVRKKIVSGQVSDPEFYGKMSKLLDAIIKERKNQALSYEQYLQKIADIARKTNEGKEDDTPSELNTSGKRALFNNLGKNKDVAIEIDTAIYSVRKADWRGNPPAENEIKRELYKILQDKNEVERIFAIIKEHPEY